jgi:hypothetical protein
VAARVVAHYFENVDYEKHLRFRRRVHWTGFMPTSVAFVGIPERFDCSGRSSLSLLSNGSARKKISDLISETMNAKDKGFSVFIVQSRDDQHTLRVVLRKLPNESTPKVAPEKAATPAQPRAYAGGAAERERAQAKAQGK